LGVIPTALLAEIAHNDGGNREALFFAVKFFVVKLGQTLGVALFAVLTLWGIDPGDDLGLRLGGIAGAGLCLMAAFAFFRFQEKSIHPGSGR
jgi:glycoside/pentoside/hexuronide:cation symporter, GPH family